MRLDARDLLSHLTAASRTRVGALVYGTPGTSDHTIGTGTLLQHRRKLFILTCKHVADEFFAAKEAWMNFDGSRHVERRDLERAYDDGQLDTAVLAVSFRATSALKCFMPISVAHIGNRDDYIRARKRTGRLYGICGFSRELAGYTRADLIAMRPMSYGTVACRTHESNSVTLEYTEMQDGTAPPDARGLSGSLIWQLSDAPQGEIWHPGKAVAMQHSWTPRKRLICSPLYRVRSWFMHAL